MVDDDDFESTYLKTENALARIESRLDRANHQLKQIRDTVMYGLFWIQLMLAYALYKTFW